mmetsp:Transcript_32918/g.52973  ORF Transcript_32918/g.52973 Transcript_32918/m.52973 type:complete len:226 (+) Transcript_32918:108-785(+)
MFFGRSLVEHLRQLWAEEPPAPKAVDTELPSESEEEIWDWDWVQDLPQEESPKKAPEEAPHSIDSIHSIEPPEVDADASTEVSETETGAVRAPEEVEHQVEGPIEEASPSELSPPVSPPAPPEPKRTKRLILPCGMPPGLVPSGSEDELADKLRKRLAKVEQEGLVLLKSQVPSLADARAFSAEEAKAARLPKWGQSTAQLLYASKRHSWFDFEELEEEERLRPE